MTTLAQATKHLTIPQLAEFTQESQAVWRKRIRLKQITYRKFGKNVRVPLCALNAWVESRTVGAVDNGDLNQTEAGALGEST